MGLFDMFKNNQTEKMTAIKATAISVLYVMGSDGDYQNEEIGLLLSILGGKSSRGNIIVGGQHKNFLDDCVEYTKKTNLMDFLNESDKILTDTQKLMIVTNLLDISMIDGVDDKDEEDMITNFVNVWGVDVNTLMQIHQVLTLKNDKKIFLDNDYVKNSPDFKFSIKFL